MATATLEKVKTNTPFITEAMEQAAHEAGIKLEYVNGIPVWEASPVYRHQKKIDQIVASLKRMSDDDTVCECVSVRDLTLLFPDGSVKRPDISIYCREPEEQDTACTQIPEAVIEILSKGYEKKDTEISLPFYLKHKIADIVLFDPATNKVSHYLEGRLEEHDSPVELTFACGCHATI